VNLSDQVIRMRAIDALRALEGTISHTRLALGYMIEVRDVIDSLADEREEQITQALALLREAHDALGIVAKWEPDDAELEDVAF
jgi:hypothetical protein